MSYLLHVDATTFDAESVSRAVARTFRDSFRGEVVHRDLAAAPLPHLTAPGISVRFSDPAAHTPEQQAALAIQDELIGEFLGAGAYLFTVPLYNYGAPSSFKAWIDQLSVVGRTIGFPGGPPARGRRGVVVTSRGGAYGPGSLQHGRDHLVPHLETILGQELGLDLEFIAPSFSLAPVVPQLAAFQPMHEASLAESHELARKLGATIALA